MSDEQDKQKRDLQFYQLILSLHGGAMQQLGKIASPISGKVERDLEQAKATIDLIDMLKYKTAGNLGDEEQKLIDHVLYELRLNYVDEANKDGEESKGSDKSSAEDDSEAKSEDSSERPQSDSKSDDN